MNLVHNIYPKSLFRMKNVRYIFLLLLLGLFFEGQASHIVGGNLQYRCIGNDRYEVTLVFIRDCGNANPEAVIDNPAIVSIYDHDYKPLRNVGGSASIGHLKMKNLVTDTIYDIAGDPCYQVAGHLCIERTVYRDTLKLPFREGGYRLAYQRCCRNTIVQNIMEPLKTGATYETWITEESMLECNGSPQSTQVPDLYVCVGQQFSFDQEFSDFEGDSIVYSLCIPNAGATYDRPIPGVHPPAPFPKIEWAPGYSTLDMMNNPADPVKISENGIITGTPLNTGTYLIGYCVEEYRNGELLSVFNSDFEVTVLPCSEIPVARIGNEELYCDGLEIEFINNSTGAEGYLWYFDASGDTTLTSTEESPTFTYTEEGCYDVKLIAFGGPDCESVATKTICVYDSEITADFTFEADGSCADSSLVFFYGHGEDPGYSIAEYKWEIIMGNDTSYYTGDTISHIFWTPGTAIVTLTAISETGCSAIAVMDDIEIQFLSLDFNPAADSICLGEKVPLLLNGNPDYTYTYVPEDGLDLTDPSNPIASPDSSIVYHVTVTDGFCTTSDSIFVKVRGSYFNVIDLSDTCSVEKILTTNHFDYSSIQWATDADFNNIIGEEDTLHFNVINEATIYVTVYDTILECYLTRPYTIEHKGLAFDYPAEFEACVGGAESIEVINLSNLDYDIIWDDSPIITSGLDSNVIEIFSDAEGKFTLRFFATAENGCTYEGFIEVSVNVSMNADFAYANECGSLLVSFTNLSDTSNVSWDFGDGNTSNEENPEHTYSEAGTYTVTLTVKNGCEFSISKTITIDEYEVNIPDQVINCNEEQTELNPGGNPDLNYTWSPSTGLDDPNSHNPRVSVTDTTMYYVTITDDNSDCQTIDSVLVIPVIGIDSDFSFEYECGSLTVDFFNETDFADVSWDFGDGNTSNEVNPSHTYTGPGSYTVVMTVNDECFGTKSVTIRVDEYEVNIPDQLSDCFGEGVELNPGGKADLNYTWSPTDGLDDPTSHNPTAHVSDSTMYYVTITDDNSDCITMDSVLVIPVELFIVTTSGNVAQCLPTAVILEASSSEGTITWYDDEGFVAGTGNSIEVIPGESDYYVATATYNGCSVSDTVKVELIDFGSLFTITADPEEIDFGASSQLDVLTTGTGNYSYEWSPREGLSDPTIRNPIARPKVTTEYCVTITDDYDCETELCITVEVREAPCEPPYIFLPNAFTPNGDGNNDVLYMRGEAITDLDLMIYNRWGQEVFRTNNKNIGWDGTGKDGEIMPTDVYGYYYKATCGDRGSYEAKGNVSLIR